MLRGRIVVAVGSGSPLLSLRGFFHRIGSLHQTFLQFRGKQLTAPDFLNSLVEKHLPEADEPEETQLARKSANRSQSISDLVRKAGFINLKYHWEGHREFFETPEEFWDLQRTFSSFARKRFSNASQEKIDAVKKDFWQTCCIVQSRGGKLVYL